MTTGEFPSSSSNRNTSDNTSNRNTFNNISSSLSSSSLNQNNHEAMEMNRMSYPADILSSAIYLKVLRKSKIQMIIKLSEEEIYDTDEYILIIDQKPLGTLQVSMAIMKNIHNEDDVYCMNYDISTNSDYEIQSRKILHTSLMLSCKFKVKAIVCDNHYFNTRPISTFSINLSHLKFGKEMKYTPVIISLLHQQNKKNFLYTPVYNILLQKTVSVDALREYHEEISDWLRLEGVRSSREKFKKIGLQNVITFIKEYCKQNGLNEFDTRIISQNHLEIFFHYFMECTEMEDTVKLICDSVVYLFYNHKNTTGSNTATQQIKVTSNQRPSAPLPTRKEINDNKAKKSLSNTNSNITGSNTATRMNATFSKRQASSGILPRRKKFVITSSDDEDDFM